MAVVVVVFCGLPAAGKSSLCAQTYQHYREQQYRVEIINYDNIYDQLVLDHKKKSFQSDLWKETREIAYGKAAEFVHHCRERSEEKVLLLVDDNMFYSSMRKKYFQLCRQYGIGFMLCHVKVDLDVCLDRNRNRHHPVPEDKIIEMSSTFQDPNPKLKSWEKNCVTIESSQLGETNVDTFAKYRGLINSMIQYASKNPVQPVVCKDTKYHSNPENFVHSGDLRLRKCIGYILSSIDSNEKRKVALILQKIKSEIMNSYKRGELFLTDFSNEETLEMQLSMLEEAFVEKYEDIRN